MTAVRYEALRETVAELFARCGLDRTQAGALADHFVLTEAKGVRSHGVGLIPKHAEQLRKGNINLRPEVKVLRETPSFALLDGDSGHGVTALSRAVAIAADKACRVGIGAVWATNLQHYGAGLTYADTLVEQGFLFELCANSPASMAPWGGRRRLFGTNPLTFGAPVGKYPPYILDMATSVTAGNKLEAAARRGERVDEGLGLDREGRPTTDPGEILAYGTLLPFGGPKGSGIAGAVNILGGVLSGGAFQDDVISLCRDPARPANYGCVIRLTDIDQVIGLDVYRRRMEVWVEEILANPPADGVEQVVYPGYREGLRLEEARTGGVALSEDSFQALAGAGSLVGMDIAALLK